MSASDPPSLVRPALPRGLIDRNAADIAAAEAMMAKIRGVYSLYGFEAVETPFIEYTDALGKFLPDQDRPNEGVFSFKDDDEQWLSLRYDLTAPLARYVAEHYEKLPKPYRTYRAGWVFRNEKPGPGRRISRTSRCPIAPIVTAMCTATRSRARAAFASSCSSTPTPSAPPASPPTPRSA
jgi:histidyl-tRNA synthetase